MTNKLCQFRNINRLAGRKSVSALVAITLSIGLLAVSISARAASLEVQKVADGIYALVGELGQRSPENLGNNATFGVIETKDGVVLIDSGGTYKGAAQIDEAIKTFTSKPVVMVINTGGQDHRWLGNAYFKQHGARIIASEAAVADQKQRYNDQLIMLDNLVGTKGTTGTRDVYADETFDTSLDLNVGGVKIQLRHPGPAHTPGDSYVWLPQQKIMFAGDIVFVDRLLGIVSESNSRAWMEAFKKIEALQPDHVIPGHGRATTLKQARKDTYEYLVMIRSKVKELVKSGGGISKLGTIDQSEFKYLKNYDQLKGRNAERVLLELEWE
jgi:glyoxylase-like metal-dependent hydrolase (beta-lactamase superfamily II)